MQTIKMCNLVKWTFSTCFNIILIGFLAINRGSQANLMFRDLPCDFLDSMNISDGVFRSNRTIFYKDLAFPQGQYAKINYTYDNGVDRTNVPPYMRGCICNRKSCIRLCCPYGSIQVDEAPRQCQPNEAANSIKVFSEQYHNDRVQNVESVRQFAFIHNYPCKRLHLVNAEYLITAVRIWWS